ncbi:MAG: SH3 domain-containing protein [Flavobacteriaceae bacterium]|nr:SH3 domain-containing protein [Flavobacteriaceae bacterium]
MFSTLGIILIVIIIFGALIGGKNLGDTVRKGCGCFVFLLIIIIGAIIYTINISEKKNDSTHHEKVLKSYDHAYFIVKQNCATYTKPNKNSKISGYLEAEEELYIENVNKFNYFYEVIEDNGKKSYILKGCLRKKME